MTDDDEDERESDRADREIRRIVRREELEHTRRYGMQPRRGVPGSCACGVCGWRAMKLPSMFSGWDAAKRGALVICVWCRKRGHSIAELEERARELAQRTLERERVARGST